MKMIRLVIGGFLCVAAVEARAQSFEGHLAQISLDAAAMARESRRAFEAIKAQAQDVSLDQLVGAWKFQLTWGVQVNDTGDISARKVGNMIEMTCADGCNTPSFLRGTPQGDGRIAWEFWPDAGVQSNCAEDKGWRSVMPVISSDGRRIDFRYILHKAGNCSKLLVSSPEIYTLTRD